jgi:2-polyprenyl-3-methyl-5-hydroxy-6-metoxy-1,4-benzoquinol methylase
MEPILDIGCGKNGKLIWHLCRQGFNATGIDQFSFSDNNLQHADWLEYNYGTAKWGTITNNIGSPDTLQDQNVGFLQLNGFGMS